MPPKLTILTLLPHYLPGYKAGGPLRTISGMVHYLGDEFNFDIITQDRDLGDDEPYYGIKVNAWQNVGKANIYYVSSDRWNLLSLLYLVRVHHYDIIYLNSLFAGVSINYLTLRRLSLLASKPIILAPRGETDPGALSLKKSKKQMYLHITKLINFYSSILWQASNQAEEKAILNVFPSALVSIAPNLAVPLAHDLLDKPKEKLAGMAHLVYLSRITPKKNLLYALECLKQVQDIIIFDIYGPIEDEKYWQQCQHLMAELPQNIQVHYKGIVKHEDVRSTLCHYHALFLPTLGENFGHAIIEAFSAGCLVLISDRTPWRNLIRLGIGWDIALESIPLYIDALNELISLDSRTFEEKSSAAIQYGQNAMASEQTITANREMFIRAHRASLKT